MIRHERVLQRKQEQNSKELYLYVRPHMNTSPLKSLSFNPFIVNIRLDIEREKRVMNNKLTGKLLIQKSFGWHFYHNAFLPFSKAISFKSYFSLSLFSLPRLLLLAVPEFKVDFNFLFLENPFKLRDNANFLFGFMVIGDDKMFGNANVKVENKKWFMQILK
jgi:hypothetical protein